jgi:hypothetical protein
LPFKLRSGFMPLRLSQSQLLLCDATSTAAALILRLNSGCISTSAKGGRIVACNLGNAITQLRDAMSATFKPRTVFAEIIGRINSQHDQRIWVAVVEKGSILRFASKVIALVAWDHQLRSVVDPRGMVSAYSVRGAVDVPLGQWLRLHLWIGWRRFIRALTDTMRRPARISIMRRSTTSEMTMTQR